MSREEVREFVKEQLRKGYIRPSKSPQTALVFFVGKKDGKKRMVVIAQGCGQTLGLGLVDKNRTVV